MSLPILTVCSALGRQGASVISAYQSANPPQYHIRALTSDVGSATARQLALQPNISVVGVDLNSAESVKVAFEGSTLIYANTAFPPAVFMESGPRVAYEVESKQGLNIVHAAAQTESLKHLIWSTLPDVRQETNGKLDSPLFQAKIPAERYIQSSESGLVDRSTFLRVGLYGSVVGGPPYTPLHVEQAQARLLVLPIAPDVAIPWAGDESVNVGVFAKAIFAQPEKTLGHFVAGTAEFLSAREWSSSLERALKCRGKNDKIVYLESSLKAYEELWGPRSTLIGSMLKFFEEYGEGSYNVGIGDGHILTAHDLEITDKLRTSEDAATGIEW